jgi:hypothetical protein
MWKIKKNGSGEKDYKNARECYEEYYVVLRDKGSCTGFNENGDEIFKVKKGIETNARQSLRFTSEPRLWKRPSLEEMLGLLDLFENKTKLAKEMDVSRSTVFLWETKANITYYHWRYLCEYAGVGVEKIIVNVNEGKKE